MLLDVVYNRPLWAAIIASAVAQILKVLIEFLTDRKFDLRRLWDTGGMPSSHSASVSALSTCIGLQEGFNSAYFAIAALFSYIVIYDARGVRRAAGLHAEILNEVVKELPHLFEEGFQPKALKTLLGHTGPQVIVGTLLGITIGVVVFYNF